jgi:hypothetical protein
MNTISNGALQLLQFGLETVILPTFYTIDTGYRNIREWVTTQANAHFNERVASVVNQAFYILPASLVLCALPSYLVYGAIVLYSAVRVFTDYFDGYFNANTKDMEAIIGIYFLVSAVANLAQCILLGGDLGYGASSLVRAFIGYTFLPIH